MKNDKYNGKLQSFIKVVHTTARIMIQKNKIYESYMSQLFVVAQKCTAQPVQSDSWIYDFYQPVVF